MSSSQRVAILGASDKSHRYAYQAFKMLLEYGHKPLPVSPRLTELAGVPVVKSLNEIQDSVDTLTMYVGPEISSRIQNEILALKPKRVIFNPGSENRKLAEALNAAGIATEEACTLVLLRTKQFDMKK